MILGYARVSTRYQNLEMQIDALKKAGCEVIYKEKASGRKTDSKQLEKLLSQIQPHDCEMTYSLSGCMQEIFYIYCQSTLAQLV